MTALRFSIRAVAVGLVLFAFLWLFIRQGLRQVPSLALMIVLVNVLLTSLIYWWVSAAPESFSFSQRYLLTLVVKLILQLLLVAVAGLADPAALVANAVFALICHLAFLVLEVIALYNKAR